MTALALRADARALPLPDASVDLIVSSPPFWAQRSYLDDGRHYDGQIGSEPTPSEYVDNLCAVTRECVRVLRPSGSIWINLGDKYASPGGHTDNTASTRLQGRPNLRKQGRPDRSTDTHGVAAKSLYGLPWRYAIRCIDELGLILRAEVIWSKPTAMPESVTDRVRRSHETWFHLTTQGRYFAAIDEIREPSSGYRRPNGAARATPPGLKPRTMTDTCNPAGRLPGSVWEIAAEPLTIPAELGDFFAAFPTEWPRRIIRGWSPVGYCIACDQPRTACSDTEQVPYRGSTATGRLKRQDMQTHHHGWNGAGYPYTAKRTTITGYVCACPEPDAPIRPSVVVDPFGGTGTTALVASTLGRIGISIDRSADYGRIAAWRTSDPAQRAKALGLPKPPVQVDGQGDLLAELGGVA